MSQGPRLAHPRWVPGPGCVEVVYWLVPWWAWCLDMSACRKSPGCMESLDQREREREGRRQGGRKRERESERASWGVDLCRTGAWLPRWARWSNLKCSRNNVWNKQKGIILALLPMELLWWPFNMDEGTPKLRLTANICQVLYGFYLK